MALCPTNAEAHVNLGGLLWGSGRRDEAIKHYAEALRLKPDQPVAHYNMGTVLVAQGKFAEAEEQFSEALRLRPNYPEALTELGRLLVGQGKLEEGLARLREAARLGPTNANLQVSLGNALMLAGQTNQARHALPKPCAWNPGLPEKMVRAGESLAAQGQMNAALARFRTALCLKPDETAALNGLARILATHPQPGIRDGKAAVDLAERACRVERQTRKSGSWPRSTSPMPRLVDSQMPSARPRKPGNWLSQPEITRGPRMRKEGSTSIAKASPIAHENGAEAVESSRTLRRERLKPSDHKPR